MPGRRDMTRLLYSWGVTQAVNTGDGGDNNGIGALQHRKGRAVAQLVYLVVYRAVLFNIGIGRRDIRLRLIIVIIGDKVFNGVFGEKFLQLGQSCAASVLLCASTSVGR